MVVRVPDNEDVGVFFGSIVFGGAFASRVGFVKPAVGKTPVSRDSAGLAGDRPPMT